MLQRGRFGVSVRKHLCVWYQWPSESDRVLLERNGINTLEGEQGDYRLQARPAISPGKWAFLSDGALFVLWKNQLYPVCPAPPWDWLASPVYLPIWLSELSVVLGITFCRVHVRVSVCMCAGVCTWRGRGVVTEALGSRTINGLLFGEVENWKKKKFIHLHPAVLHYGFSSDFYYLSLNEKIFPVENLLFCSNPLLCNSIDRRHS